MIIGAKSTFRDDEGIEYKTLDVSKNPLEQDFAASAKQHGR